MTERTVYDVAVIGAGPAGAQAAVSAAHQMRHVLVLDAAPVSQRTGRAYWSKSVELQDAPVFPGITGPRFSRALREWMDHLARFAMTKAGLADAIRQAVSAPGTPGKPGHEPVKNAAERLLRANEDAGTIRPGVTADDFLLAIAGLWQITPEGDWQARVDRLLDLVMDGLRAGAPGR